MQYENHRNIEQVYKMVKKHDLFYEKRQLLSLFLDIERSFDKY